MLYKIQQCLISIKSLNGYIMDKQKFNMKKFRIVYRNITQVLRDNKNL